MSVIAKSTPKKAIAIKPEVKIVLERCVGCQECIIRCPTQALSMDVTNWKAAANNDLCVGCRQCQRTCPFSAISVVGPRMVADRTHFSPYNHRVVIGENNEVRPGFANLKEAIKEAE